MWTTIDAGTVVNPDRVRAQMEGAVIFGMSLTLHGEITGTDGAIVQGNFDNYPVLRMNEAPRAINVHIMQSTARPGGVGETGVPPVAPAICNAIFAATGKRVRELPLRNVSLI
jgi:isoquinoline 1-oxidoreductase beta subunit